MSEVEQKPVITKPSKSSMEILSELFSTFDAEPPLIIKKEKDETKKHKKSKKKHKHKDKKHKKKDKKRKRSDSSSSERSGVDLAELLIKQEAQSSDKKIKLEDPHLENVKSEKKEPKTESCERSENIDTNKSKITIKNLKFSSIFEATIREVQKKEEEEGEVSSSEEESKKKDKHKKKHKHHDDKTKKKHSSREKDKHCKVEERYRSPSRHSREDDWSKRHKRSRERSADRFKDDYKSNKSRERSMDMYKDRNDYKSRDRSRDHYFKTKDDYKAKYKDTYYKEKERDPRSDDKYKYRQNPFYKEDDRYKEEIVLEEEKWPSKDRHKGHNEHDERHKDRSSSHDRIDKKKLLEIARKNAIQMMKSGSLPAALSLGRQAQEKVLAAIKAGGKTIEELTDFCKTLSKKEELGELSSVSGDENGCESDLENKAFHHPFQIKDRPTSIVMNIKNAVSLPTKTAQERSAELRMQFPVSSGTQHRKTENEWVPVSSKKTETSAAPSPPLALVEPPKPPPIEVAPPEPSVPPPGPQVFPSGTNTNIDIGSIVSERLQAMRKLQENPYDVEALTKMQKSQRQMQTWAESKQQPGQFTGSTGANILTQAELSAGYQAWTRKDQLQNAAPVSGGMGMHLLKKMGWNPGEGLGKEKTGTLEPLVLEVKLDKKGLVANEEQKKKQQKAQKFTVKTLEGKHPVSLLGEYTAKKKLGAPQYTLCLESGPDHKKMFLFKVTVNGTDYQPGAPSPNKKQAKADAAKLCLQHSGLLPS